MRLNKRRMFLMDREMLPRIPVLPVYSEGMVSALRIRLTDNFPLVFYDMCLEQGSRDSLMPNNSQTNRTTAIPHSSVN